MWSKNEQKHWDDFVNRVEHHFKRFDAGRVHYATSMYDPVIRVSSNSDAQIVIDLSGEVQGLDLYYTLDNTWPTIYSPKYSQRIIVPKDVDLFRVVAYKNGEACGKVISLTADELKSRAGK
jgi:hexosaminidase